MQLLLFRNFKAFGIHFFFRSSLAYSCSHVSSFGGSSNSDALQF